MPRSKRKTLFSNIKFNKPLAPRPLVYALQSNIFKGLCTEADCKDICYGSCFGCGTFCTQVIPVNGFFRSDAWREQASPCRQRKSTTCRATMGLVYFVLIALNKDQGPRGGSGSGSDSMEDPVEEARKIMEKYK
ncbi:hypothetical protein V6N11_059900 [Hibiscus sabdariffa]|uniref:Uncharacterized protein n=1 Tax=Hibiscus sabdariffa TaxID=183260 RepID=A0ABR2NYE8_9ROSI